MIQVPKLVISMRMVTGTPPMSKAHGNEITLSPERMGAKACPRCGDKGKLKIELKNIAKGTYFVELSCEECYREAISEVHGRAATAIQEALARWNSLWPDVSEYITGDSEGISWN